MCDESDLCDLEGDFKVIAWLVQQITEFNVLSFLAIIIFTTVLSRANLQKMLKEQSQELYNDFEELKDEIRGNTSRK